MLQETVIVIVPRCATRQEMAVDVQNYKSALKCNDLKIVYIKY